jgi:hypothetical protein
MDLINQPYTLPFLFLGLWLFMSAFFGIVSGWWSLAEHFRARSRPAGQKILGQVKQIGIVPEHLVTSMIASPAGLYLSVNLLFRLFHPPLLIPWSEVHYARKIQTLWWRTYEFDLASITGIKVKQGAYDVICPYKPQ